MKVSELEGAELDWWVAKAQGWYLQVGMKSGDVPVWNPANCTLPLIPRDDYHPSTDWSHGGPIIHRKNIAIFPYTDRWAAVCQEQPEDWIDIHMWDEDATGETPLIAAMRAYVFSTFGDEVPDDR